MSKMTNQELLEKAIVTTDAIAAQGKLNPAQADKFIDYVFDLTGLSGKVRTVKFRNEQYDIDKINIGKRAAVPKQEAKDPGVRRGITTSKVSLNPKEIMLPVEISDTFLDINLEGASVEDHIMKMFAKQFANDLEELYIDGDILGPAQISDDIYDDGDTTSIVKDTYLGLTDGWLKIARGGNVVDANGTNIGSALFSKMLNAIPEKYKRNKMDMKFFLSSNSEQNYRLAVSNRATAAGDNALNSTSNLTPFGMELVPVPLLSQTPRVTEHVTLTGTTAVQLKFKNIVSASDIVVLTSISGKVSPYTQGAGNDYVMDYTNGTIARDGASTIPSGTTVKISYRSESQILLTHYMNLIVGVGRDIRIEKDRDIYKSVNQYAITAKVSSQIENLEAVVLAKNVGLN